MENNGESKMIEKEEFYKRNESPDYFTQKKIWKNVERSIKPLGISFLNVHDPRSFYFGMAASFILIFFLIGVYTSAKALLYEVKPEEVKLNTAYQSAIKEFERVIPDVVSNIPQTSIKRSVVAVKMEELNYINSAIEELRKENLNHDLSPLKQMSLRQLYINKLKTLQDILEQGEVSI